MYSVLSLAAKKPDRKAGLSTTRHAHGH